jgi:hypothetical protein
MKYEIRLPDVSKVAIFRREKSGQFVGQATFWKRAETWELIGCTRNIGWIYEVRFEELKEAMESKGLVVTWRDAPKFLVEHEHESEEPEPETGIDSERVVSGLSDERSLEGTEAESSGTG